MRSYGPADFRGVYFAHRGLYNNEKGVPENSLAAFRAAAEKGYGVELDVQVTKDGQVIVFHDDTLERMCGESGYIWDRTLAELRTMRLLGTGETVPLFTEVLEVLKGGAGPLIVELKDGPRNRELCEKTREILKSYPRVFCIESFNPLIVFWFRRKAPEIFRGQLAQPASYYGGKPDPILARLLAKCRFSLLYKPDFYAYRIGPRPKKVLRARKKGVLLIAWSSRNAEKDAEENDAVIFEYCEPPKQFRIQNS